MLINEAGLVRAIKRAYKHGGYVVANLGDAVAIYTENWYIQANRALFSRKALATIVIDTVRKARSSWAKEWERAVWNALEGVDLHKEEAGA